MGGTESKIKFINIKLDLKYQKLNIQDLDKLFSDAFYSIKNVEIIRCEYILRWNDFVRLTGGIVLENPKFESCMQGMLWKYAVDISNLSWIEILPEEPFIKLNNPVLISEEDVEISRSLQDLCRFYAANFEQVFKLEAEMNKYDKEGKEYLKDPESILSNRNVAPIDIFTYSKRLNLNVKKMHIAYEVIFQIRNCFEDIRRGLQRYSIWLKEPEQVKRFEEIGIHANAKHITRPTKIVYTFTKEEKLPSYEDHIEIMQDDLNAEKEARAVLESSIVKGTFILTYSKNQERLKEQVEAMTAKARTITEESMEVKEQIVLTNPSIMYRKTEESEDVGEAKALFESGKSKRKAYDDYDYQLEKENLNIMMRNPVTKEYEHTFAKSEKIQKRPSEKILKKTKSHLIPSHKALNYSELLKEVEKLRAENRILTSKIQARELTATNIIDTSKMKPLPSKTDKSQMPFKFPISTRHHVPLKNWNLILSKTVTSDHIQKIYCIEPAIDIGLLITGGNLGNVTFWNYNNFVTIIEHKVMNISHSAISSLSYLNDGKTLFCGCQDGKLYRIDLGIFSAKLIAELGSSINNLTYMKNGFSLLAASGKKIFEIDIVNEKVLNSIDAHDMEVTDLAYNHKKCILVSSSKDKTIKIWNPQTKECLGILRGHASAIDSICFAFSSNFLYIVSCARDSYITFWNLTDKNLTKTIKMNSMGKKVLYLQDKKSVMCVNKNGSLILYNLEKEIEKKELSFQKAGYLCAAYFDDGSNIVLGSKDGSLEFWNAMENQETS